LATECCQEPGVGNSPSADYQHPTPSTRSPFEAIGLVAMTQPHSQVAEAYRMLRTNLAFARLKAGARTIVVTSAGAGEGKTITAANLAVVVAETGKRVIL